MQISILGFGDIGRRVAARELRRGNRPIAVARNPRPMEGIRTFKADLDRPAELRDLPWRGSIVYYLAPPPGEGGGDSRMENWLGILKPEDPPRKILYLSTTGVYGDCKGAWVDEETPPRPQTLRARRRLDAERRLRRWSETTGIPLVVLRVGGIYGPGRLPVEAIRHRRPVLRPEEAPCSNRIHADDLALLCVAAAHHPHPTGITLYNATDGKISTMTDYYHTIADALGLPRCPEIDRGEAERLLSPAMLSYLDESRRVDSRRILHELGITLQYPDLVAGLASFLAPPLPTNRRNSSVEEEPSP